MTRSVGFQLAGPPAPKARPRLGAGGNVFTPQRTKVYEEAIGWAYRSASAEKFVGPIKLEVWVREDRRPSIGDWDNYGKVVSDALNGLAYDDDRQVIEAHVYVERRSDDPGMTVIVTEVGDE